jgi:hypothetical protein
MHSGRTVTWASAWRPGPSGKAVCGAVSRCTRSPRTGWCGGERASGLVAASRWQGFVGELAGATGRTPCKTVGGGAHPSSGAVERRWRASGSGIQQRRDGSGDWWQWRRGPAVSGRKREGEAHGNWEPRCTEERLTEEAVAWTPSDEAVRRPEVGADRLGGEMRGGGAWSGWR